jgi:tetrahydromethanopterin S-methyltransferase subunit B
VAVPSEKTVSVSQRFLEGIMEEVTKLQEEIADLDQDTEALVRSAYLLLREATRRKNKAL